MAPAEAAAAAALDAAIHAWDIAMGTGQASPLSPALARALTPVARSIVEPLRQYGAYAAALEAGAGADDAATLLCYLGRSPVWTAGGMIVAGRAPSRCLPVGGRAGGCWVRGWRRVR